MEKLKLFFEESAFGVLLQTWRKIEFPYRQHSLIFYLHLFYHAGLARGFVCIHGDDAEN